MVENIQQTEIVYQRFHTFCQHKKFFYWLRSGFDIIGTLLTFFIVVCGTIFCIATSLWNGFVVIGLVLLIFIFFAVCVRYDWHNLVAMQETMGKDITAMVRMLTEGMLWFQQSSRDRKQQMFDEGMPYYLHTLVEFIYDEMRNSNDRLNDIYAFILQYNHDVRVDDQQRLTILDSEAKNHITTDKER